MLESVECNKVVQARSMVAELKRNSQDFEWYPTTLEMMREIKHDLARYYHTSTDNLSCSVLDCGAGDGRVLTYLTAGHKYAIEKAMPLLSSLPKDVFVVGTDFHQQTLIDKKVDCVYANPPYSEFDLWVSKIIKEANASLCYFVIPKRWKDSTLIMEAIKNRSATAEIIGKHDFSQGDRQARVDVEIVRVSLTYCQSNYSSGSKQPIVHPFNLWFETHFALQIQKRQKSECAYSQATKKRVSDLIDKDKGLVAQEGIIKILVDAYNRDLAHLVSNYKNLTQLDADLLNELNVSVESVRAALRLKIEGLKALYWNELVNRVTSITDRLTSQSRKLVLEKIQQNMSVDFTTENAFSIVMWVIKNANDYADDQVVNVVQRLTQQANVVNYKSNQRTFKEEDWRYGKTPDELAMYKLDYNVIFSSTHVIKNPSLEDLVERASFLLDDLLAVALTLGFDVSKQKRTKELAWENNLEEFRFVRVSTHEEITLFNVRLYKNGNMHIKFNQRFICKLNVTFGKLKGWLKNASDAAAELDIAHEDAMESFNSLTKIGYDKVEQLIQLPLAS